jgi:hypothetical protein
MNNGWSTPDIAALLAQRNEDTTSANVGQYTVPLGGMLRQPLPAGWVETPPCHGSQMCTVEEYFDAWERLSRE